MCFCAITYCIYYLINQSVLYMDTLPFILIEPFHHSSNKPVTSLLLLLEVAALEAGVLVSYEKVFQPEKTHFCGKHSILNMYLL